MTSPPPQQSKLLTTLEAAAYLRLSKRTLEGYRTGTDGPPYHKLGPGKAAKVVYRPEELDAWVNRFTKDPNPPAAS